MSLQLSTNCTRGNYNFALNIAIVAEIWKKKALYLIPDILNYVVINVLSQSKKNTFSTIFYSHRYAQLYFLGTTLKYVI